MMRVNMQSRGSIGGWQLSGHSSKIGCDFAAGSASLKVFQKRPECNADRIAAIGYCIGGCGACFRHATGSLPDDSAGKVTNHYPWWLDKLADDVTGEGAAIEGTLHGAEEVRKLLLDARELYEQHEFQFTGNYGDKGFIEEYTCLIQGAPTSAVVTVTRNGAGKAQHIVVNHRPRSSVLLFVRVMGEKYVGTPLAKYFTTSECLSML
jgi:hypothetical protein